jgi:LPXTG-motif cell wall-anchored protein
MYQHLLAGLAAITATTLGTAVPAQAASTEAGLWLNAAYNVGVDDEITVQPHLSAPRPVTVTGATITYELSGDLAGVSLVSPAAGGCTNVSPTRLTCTAAGGIALGPSSRSEHLNAVVKTTAAAVMGATGTLRTTFSADGVEASVDTATVRVIDRIDMAVPEPEVTVSVAPGDAFGSRWRLTNIGRSVIRGVGVLFSTPAEIEPPEQFSNCIYGYGVLRGCQFKQDLQPGVTYEMDLPSRLRKDAVAPGTVVVDGLWTDNDDYLNWAAELLGGGSTRGTGGPLAFVPVTGARQATEQYDRTGEDNWQHLTVEMLGGPGPDVTPSATPPSPGGPGGPGGTGGTGGTGGGLPVTGPRGAAIGVTGGLLLAAGVSGVLLARRRRARFEA